MRLSHPLFFSFMKGVMCLHLSSFCFLSRIFDLVPSAFYVIDSSFISWFLRCQTSIQNLSYWAPLAKPGPHWPTREVGDLILHFCSRMLNLLKSEDQEFPPHGGGVLMLISQRNDICFLPPFCMLKKCTCLRIYL